MVVAEDGMCAVQAVFRTQPDRSSWTSRCPGCHGYVAARLLKEDWSTPGHPGGLLT